MGEKVYSLDACLTGEKVYSLDACLMGEKVYSLDACLMGEKVYSLHILGAYYLLEVPVAFSSFKTHVHVFHILKGTSRQRSGKGVIRKRSPLQKPRWEKTKLTIRHLYHETYRKPNEQLFSQ